MKSVVRFFPKAKGILGLLDVVLAECMYELPSHHKKSSRRTGPVLISIGGMIEWIAIVLIHFGSTTCTPGGVRIGGQVAHQEENEDRGFYFNAKRGIIITWAHGKHRK